LRRRRLRRRKAAAASASKTSPGCAVIPNPRQDSFVIGLNYETPSQENRPQRAENPTVFGRFANRPDSGILANIHPAALCRRSARFSRANLLCIMRKPGRYISAAPRPGTTSPIRLSKRRAGVRDFAAATPINLTARQKIFPTRGAFVPAWMVTPDEAGDLGRCGLQPALTVQVVQDATISHDDLRHPPPTPPPADRYWHSSFTAAGGPAT